jgi:PhoPQ-activated pathogenicity-related protein
LWQATNPNARDFRVDTIGKAYTVQKLAPQADGTYLGKVERPKNGFTAFFVELVYPTGKKYPLKFSTDVSVVPDILPFKMPTAAQ